MAKVPGTNLSAWLIDHLHMDSAQKWHCFSDVIEMFIYALYAITKGVLVILIACRWCRNYKPPQIQSNPNPKYGTCNCLRKVNAEFANLLFSAPTGFVSSHQKPPITSVQIKNVADKNQTDSRICRAPTGSVSSHQRTPNISVSIEKVANENETDSCTCCNFEVPGVYINDYEASHIDVAILAMVTLTMILVVISTFWYHLWIKVDIIDTCKNDSGIQCYPRINNQLDYHHPYIQNCEQWENQENVKFHCFRFNLNFDKTFIMLGGFISLFLRLSRNGPKIFIACVTCLYKKKYCSWCVCCCDDSRSKLSHDYCFKKHRLLCREILAFVLNGFEVVLCLGLACGYIVHLCGIDIYNSSEAYFGSVFADFLYTIYDSLNKVILPLGVVSTSLLLPYEDYIAKDTKNDSTQDEEAPDNHGESTSHNCNLSGSKTTYHHVSIKMEALEDTESDEKRHLVDDKDKKHYNSVFETRTQSVRFHNSLV